MVRNGWIKVLAEWNRLDQVPKRTKEGLMTRFTELRKSGKITFVDGLPTYDPNGAPVQENEGTQPTNDEPEAETETQDTADNAEDTAEQETPIEPGNPTNESDTQDRKERRAETNDMVQEDIPEEFKETFLKNLAIGHKDHSKRTPMTRWKQVKPGNKAIRWARKLATQYATPEQNSSVSMKRVNDLAYATGATLSWWFRREIQEGIKKSKEWKTQNRTEMNGLRQNIEDIKTELKDRKNSRPAQEAKQRARTFHHKYGRQDNLV